MYRLYGFWTWTTGEAAAIRMACAEIQLTPRIGVSIGDDVTYTQMHRSIGGLYRPATNGGTLSTLSPYRVRPVLSPHRVRPVSVGGGVPPTASPYRVRPVLSPYRVRPVAHGGAWAPVTFGAGVTLRVRIGGEPEVEIRIEGAPGTVGCE